jgi:hypothetical protein
MNGANMDFKLTPSRWDAEIDLVFVTSENQSHSVGMTWDQVERLADVLVYGLMVHRGDTEPHACGHFHSGDECPTTPCGNYRCCIN